MYSELIATKKHFIQTLAISFVTGVALPGVLRVLDGRFASATTRGEVFNWEQFPVHPIFLRFPMLYP